MLNTSKLSLYHTTWDYVLGATYFENSRTMAM